MIRVFFHIVDTVIFIGMIVNPISAAVMMKQKREAMECAGTIEKATEISKKMTYNFYKKFALLCVPALILMIIQCIIEK